MINRYPDLPTLLAAIRMRPGMFLGHKSVHGLRLFLSGIEFAENFHGLAAADRMGGFDATKFEQWVERRYNTERLSLNSFSLAAHFAESDAAGLDQWFEWYDKFVLEMN